MAKTDSDPIQVGPGRDAYESSIPANVLPGGLIVYRDADSSIIAVNDRSLAIFECESEADFTASYQYFFDCVHPDDVSQLNHQLRHQRHEDGFSYTRFRIVAKGGAEKNVEASGRTVQCPGDEGIVHCIMIDEMSRKHRSGDIDQLTGLLTMTSFERHARAMVQIHDWARSGDGSLAFLSIDLENFKVFNDEYGYEKGDELLCRAASSIKSVFSDGPSARFADDHFVVLTENVDLEQRMTDLAEKLRLAHPDGTMQAKIGVYLAAEGENPTSCVDRAKSARVAIKKDYSTVYRYHAQHDWERISLESYIADHIDEAIEKNWIVARYQPVIRVMTGKICGWEALARWQDPSHGTMMPGDFIPAIERFNLSHKLDLAMTRIVCRDLSDAIHAGREILPISINLSRSDFQTCDMPSEILKIADEYGIPYRMLHIEVTESALCDEETRLISALDKLNEIGFKLWMDDFGNGYSTLSVLKDYDFDMLKIDMRFLRDTTDGEHARRARAIITAIVAMAKQVGLRTLAEGVENDEHLRFLRDIGCEMAQGFLFSKPIPIALADSVGFEKELYADASYYDALGRIEMLDRRTLNEDTCILASVLPTVLGERIDGKFVMVRANDVFKETVRTLWDMSMEEYWEFMIEGPNALMRPTLIELADRALETGEELRATVQVTDKDDGEIRVRHIATNSRTGAEAYLVTNPRMNDIVFV